MVVEGVITIPLYMGKKGQEKKQIYAIKRAALAEGTVKQQRPTKNRSTHTRIEA